MTIYIDSIGNKFVGYDGQYTNTLSGFDILNPNNSSSIDKLIESFSGVITEKATASVVGTLAGIVWNVDNVQPNADVSGNNAMKTLGNGDYGLSFLDFGSFNTTQLMGLSASKLSQNNVYPSLGDINDTFYDLFGHDATFGVAQMSSKNDFGIFFWNDENNFEFLWLGETKGNPNISVPQNRAAIYIGKDAGTIVDQKSFGVKQADSTTRRLQLDTEAGANHLIDCGTDTGRLYLIEDDGAGGDNGTVGYCPNLYLSKKAGLTVGGFVTLDGITDGGSEQGIVVGQWGDSAHLIMRVYDGVN